MAAFPVQTWDGEKRLLVVDRTAVRLAEEIYVTLLQINAILLSAGIFNNGDGGGDGAGIEATADLLSTDPNSFHGLRLGGGPC